MKYTSKYTDSLVTPANHIVEILLERKALKDGKKLTYKFWELAEWKKPYNFALIQVSAILNAYSEKTVISVLNREKWAWSIGPKIKQAIIEEEAKLARLETQKVVSQAEVATIALDESLPTSRPSFQGSKLKNLD
jgi:hypothetical protein